MTTIIAELKNFLKSSDYYHVAPTVDRERIRQHGLQPSWPPYNPSWQISMQAEDPFPTGVYAFPDDPQRAEKYRQNLVDKRGEGHDIWSIPDRIPDRPGARFPESPYEWQADPDVSGADYTESVVPDPVLHSPYEDTVSWPHERQSNWQIVADNETLDSRNFPDPTAPRPAGKPEPKGCTCKDGWKLECPVHGMNSTEQDKDYTWSIPQGSPIGFPSDQPRSWQQAHSHIVSTTHAEWSTTAVLNVRQMPLIFEQETIKEDWTKLGQYETKAHKVKNQEHRTHRWDHYIQQNGQITNDVADQEAVFKKPGHISMIAQANSYYHVAPSRIRDNFQQNGPQQSNPAENPQWNSFGVYDQPGFYAWNTLPAAQEYRNRLVNHRDEPHDIWEVQAHPGWFDEDKEMIGDEEEMGGQSLVYRGDEPLTDYRRIASHEVVRKSETSAKNILRAARKAARVANTIWKTVSVVNVNY